MEAFIPIAFLVFMFLLFLLYAWMSFHPSDKQHSLRSLPLLHILVNNAKPYDCDYFLKKYRKYIGIKINLEALDRIEKKDMDYAI
jgi:hypothetical protein